MAEPFSTPPIPTSLEVDFFQEEIQESSPRCFSKRDVRPPFWVLIYLKGHQKEPRFDGPSQVMKNLNASLEAPGQIDVAEPSEPIFLFGGARSPPPPPCVRRFFCDCFFGVRPSGKREIVPGSPVAPCCLATQSEWRGDETSQWGHVMGAFFLVGPPKK